MCKRFKGNHNRSKKARKRLTGKSADVSMSYLRSPNCTNDQLFASPFPSEQVNSFISFHEVELPYHQHTFL